MNKEWRPKGWKNPFTLEQIEGYTPLGWRMIDGTIIETQHSHISQLIYEAGADAMLGALSKEANGRKIWFDKTDRGDILIFMEVE